MSSNDLRAPALPTHLLSADHPLHDCRKELEDLYHVIHCRYGDDSELSDRRIVLSHLQRLMVAMCAPTLRERFDADGAWRNPATTRFMDEIRQMFVADSDGSLEP